MVYAIYIYPFWNAERRGLLYSSEKTVVLSTIFFANKAISYPAKPTRKKMTSIAERISQLNKSVAQDASRTTSVRMVASPTPTTSGQKLKQGGGVRSTSFKETNTVHRLSSTSAISVSSTSSLTQSGVQAQTRSSQPSASGDGRATVSSISGTSYKETTKIVHRSSSASTVSISSTTSVSSTSFSRTTGGQVQARSSQPSTGSDA